MFSWKDPSLPSSLLPSNSAYKKAPQRFRKKMDEYGIVILRKALDPNVCRTMKRKCNKWLSTQTLFSLFNTSGRMIGRRKQADLTYDARWANQTVDKTWPHIVKEAPSETSDVFVRVGNLARRFISPHHMVRQASVLQSEPDNVRQYVHRDYNDEVCTHRRRQHDYQRLSRVASYGAILALEDGTEFVCWPGSHRHRDTEGKFTDACGKLGPVHARDAVCPVLNAGDVIFFMDTLAHAGSQYDLQNTRMHFYCDDVIADVQCRSFDALPVSGGGRKKRPQASRIAAERRRQQFRTFCYGRLCQPVEENTLSGNKSKKQRCVLRHPNYTDDAVEEIVGDQIHYGRKTKKDKAAYDGFLASWRGEKYRKPNVVKRISLSV